MSELIYKARLNENDDSVIYSDDYSKHISAMTGEGLHSKSDIAVELAYRDIQLNKANERIAELEKAQEWISVEDRLPNDNSGYRVIAFCNDIVGSWTQILHHNGKFFLQEGGGEFPPIVTHWMPLPPQPNK